MILNFVILISVLFSTLSHAHLQKKIRGIRVDPGYFYETYPNLSAKEIATTLVNKAKSSGVNTLFVYAYSSVYGAYYKTSYKLTRMENGFGSLNIFRLLTDEAKRNGLAVIGVIPVNDFKNVWEAKKKWRAKNKLGFDYIPNFDVFLLSAWHPDFKIWFSGFVDDLLLKNPSVDGVEALEPTIDYSWSESSDFNSVATIKFKSLYPIGLLRDSNWLKVRAQGLTDLIGIMNERVHLFKKKSFVVQTWDAKPNGQLIDSNELKNRTGFDFEGIMNLNGIYKMDYVMAEIIWQQWASEFGTQLLIQIPAA